MGIWEHDRNVENTSSRQVFLNFLSVLNLLSKLAWINKGFVLNLGRSVVSGGGQETPTLQLISRQLTLQSPLSPTLWPISTLLGLDLFGHNIFSQSSLIWILIAQTFKGNQDSFKLDIGRWNKWLNALHAKLHMDLSVY